MLTASKISGVPVLKALVLIVAPKNEPISLSEAKTHLRGIMGSEEDDLLRSLITSVRLKVEQHIRRALITQTWDAVYDDVPAISQIEVPLPVLQSITSITTYDRSNIGTVFDSLNYFVDTFSEPGRVALNDGKTWPTGTFREVNAFIVRFVSGYGVNAVVPDAIKQAMLQSIGFFYKNKTGTHNKNQIKGLPEIAKEMLSSYRIVRI